jgi:IstB-like ATP binding protein
MLGPATGRIGVGDRRRVGSAPRPVVARERPHVAGLGLTAPGIEHWAARLVTEQFWRRLQQVDELGFVPLSQTGAELLFEVFSQRYERGSTIVTSNLPFDEWTSVFGSERLTGALLDRLTHHVHILEMNGESYRLAQSKRRVRRPKPDTPPGDATEN